MSKLLDRITKAELENHYNFLNNGLGNALISELKLTTNITIYDDRSFVSGDHVVYKVDLIRPSGESVLEFAFERNLFPEKVLWSKYCRYGTSVIGRVVCNVCLFIKTEYQRKGLAKLIYKAEDLLYRKWGEKANPKKREKFLFRHGTKRQTTLKNSLRLIMQPGIRKMCRIN